MESILCLLGWEHPEEVVLQMGELFEGLAELLAQSFELFIQLLFAGLRILYDRPACQTLCFLPHTNEKGSDQVRPLHP